jgi:hypothetical protein
MVIKKKIMREENTYPEVIQNCSLDSPVVSIRGKMVVVPSSGKLPVIILRQCHHTRVVKTNQVTQHLVDYLCLESPSEAIVNSRSRHITK